MKPWLKTLLTWAGAILGAGSIGGLITTATAPTPVVIRPAPPVVNPTPPVVVAPQPPPPPIRVVPASPAPEQVAVTLRMLDEHNRARAAKGLPPYRADNRLICSATLAAAIDVQQHIFSHFGLYGSTPWLRMKTFGVPNADQGSENLAMGTRSEAETVAAWLDEPDRPDTHRANVLSPKFTHLGAAMRPAADGTPVWCADYSIIP